MSEHFPVTDEDIRNWLEPILTNNLKINNPKIQIVGNTEKGDGFIGDITFVQVDDDTKKYNFVVKSGKKSEAIRKVMPIRQAFLNEIYMYEKIVPMFDKLQVEKNVKNPFKNTIKCYGTLVLENIEILALKNLKEKNFYLWPKNMPMSLEHIQKVVKNYGKLHALSYAIRDQKPEVFKEFSKNLVDVFKKLSEQSDEDQKAKHWGTTLELAKQRNKMELCKKIQEELFESHYYDFDSDPYFVVVHGDCWNNNFMFSYKDKKNEVLDDMCFLDLQMSKIGSPVLDLSYFLFCCADPDDLVAHFDELMNCYYESLSELLRELGSDPNKMFPFEELMNQWKKYSHFGLQLMPSLIKICLQEKDEVKDFTDLKDNDMTALFSNSLRNIKEFERRVISILEFAINKGFL